MVLIGTIDIPTYVYNLQNAEKCFCVNKVTKKELDFLLKNNISQFFIKSRTESARNLWPIHSFTQHFHMEGDIGSTVKPKAQNL